MSDSPSPRPADTDDLRRQWHEHADAVFNRLFPEDAQAPPPSFAQLEQRSEQLARDLAAWLLERRVQADPQARPNQPPACPRGGQPARRVTQPEESPPKRVVTTRVGEVELAREKWRCTTCRVVFFPPR
jgi:hypothetical protein